METSQFIDQLAAGQAADARQTLTDLLSSRAFEALEGRKQDLAKSLFSGQEVETQEEVPAE